MNEPLADQRTTPKGEKPGLRGGRFIFVGGVPRSGTTLVQNILDSHPDIFGLPEFLLLPEIVRIRKWFRKHTDSEKITDICSMETADDNLCRYIESFLNPMIDKYKCRLVSEKTPYNIEVFTDLIQLFPGARFIHVVRDPRAVVASLFEVGEKAKKRNIAGIRYDRSIRATIETVRSALIAGLTVSEQSSEKVLTVIYEKLLQDPEKETQRICQYLNIPWSEQMIYPSRFKHLGERAIISLGDSAWYDEKMFNRDPDTSNIDKWKKKLTPAQQVRITNAFKDIKALRDLGYDFSLNHLTFGEKLKGRVVSFLRSKIGDLRLSLARLISGDS